MLDDLEKRQLLAELQEKMFRRRERIRLGRYMLIERLGSGAMGVVYRAEDPQLQREVAVKVLHPQRTDVAAGHDRLRREARALGQVRHPNVIEVYDVGEADGRVFVAMELVRGRSLDAWLVAEPRPWRVVVDVFVQAGRGLAAAHQAGLVHRDFKPSNVQIADDDTVRVLDFGLAKAIVVPAVTTQRDDHAIAGDGRATVEGALVGTPRYMPPKQLLGAPADAPSDQYAFCVALWEALFGEPPFDPDDMIATKRSLERARLRPTLPVPLRIQRALRRGLAPEPADRFPGMEPLLVALRSRPRRLPAALAAAAIGTLVGAWALWPSAPAPVTTEASPEPPSVDPLALAEVQAELADCQELRQAGQTEAADARSIALLERARKLGHRALLANAGHERGRVLVELDRGPEAIEVLETAHGDAVAAVHDRRRFGIALDLAGLEIQSRQDLERGRRWYGDARAVLERIGPDARLRYALAQADLVLARAEGDGIAALTAARDTVRFAREGWDADDQAVLRALQALGVAALDQHRFDEARAALDEAIATGERTLGPDHSLPAYCLSILAAVDAMEASTSEDDGALAERAVASARRAAAAFARAMGSDHHDAINARLHLGIVLAEVGRPDEARIELEYAIARLEQAEVPDTPGIAVGAESLGTVLAELGELEAAEASLQRAVILTESLRGQTHPQLITQLTHLGSVQRSRGAVARARESYERAIRIAGDESPGPRAAALEALAVLERADGQPHRAAALDDAAAQAWEELLGPDADRTRAARKRARIPSPGP